MIKNDPSNEIQNFPNWIPVVKKFFFLNEKIMLDNKSPEKIYIVEATQSLIIVNSEKLLMKELFKN